MAKRVACRGRAEPGRQSSVSYIPPGVIVAVLLVLIVSQLCFAFLPFRKRGYIPVLVMTALGFAIGQGWDFLGLPSLRFGDCLLYTSDAADE